MLKYPFPPLPTQRRIAAILDKADALRRKDRELLDQYDELVQAVFWELFGDPVKNDKEWDKKTLEEVCMKITDGTHHSPPSVENGVPYITAKHIKPFNVEFDSAPSFVSFEDHKKIYSRCAPEKGDILYIKDGATTGIAAVNPFDFEFSMLSSLALIKPDLKQITSEYLAHWLNNETIKNSYLQKWLEWLSKGLH